MIRPISENLQGIYSATLSFLVSLLPVNDSTGLLAKLFDLGKNIYIANFNVQDKNEPCMYSDKGQFTVGAGIMTEVDTKTKQKTTDWFLVNHLGESQIQNGSECDND
uniref:Uncharacterized protein n=1 Tax=Magallana gigas TaxID=29159 RepID=K1R1U8_MAGGI